MENLEVFEKSIILIGPLSTGKTTIANILKTRLDMAHYSMDGLGRESLENYGYNKQMISILYKSKSYTTLMRYIQKYYYLYLKDIIEGLKIPTVLELGAYDTIPSSPKGKEEIKNCFEKFENVVLLLPSSDPVRSLEVLRNRWDSHLRNKKYEIGSFEDMINWYLLNNDINESLATIVVYTDNKTEYEVADEIVDMIIEKRSNKRM